MLQFIHMTKKISLKLKSIKYSGDSIGDDIRLEVDILGKSSSVKKNIKTGTQQKFDKIVGEFDTDKKIFESNINLRIIEDDPVFNDIGNLETKIKIDTSKQNQEFSYEVSVKEFRVNFSKAKAIFVITLQAEILGPETYLSETQDGWLAVKIKGLVEEKSLPAFLRVKLLKSDNKRDYFNVLEGFYTGKQASVKKRPDNTSYIQNGILEREPTELVYSISKKSFTADDQTYVADDDPNNLLKLGIYDIEIPDAPHELGRKYLDRARFALVWFRIGHSGDRYVHTGSVSAGCLSMNEIKKWDSLCIKMLKARKGDRVSVGTLRVIE